MMTYDAMNMLFQFGIFLATSLTALVAVIAVVINKKVTTLRYGPSR